MGGLRRNIEYVRKLAAKKGGECLSPVFLGMKEKHWFRCEKCSLKWEESPKFILRRKNYFCPFCARCRTKKNLEYIKHISHKKGGTCLSSEYIGMNKKYRFKCGGCHHEWEAVASDIAKGGWCPPCSRNGRRKDIDHIKSLANRRGGQCLSTVYCGMNKKYWFKCGDCHHEWEAMASEIQQGGWCPHCCIGKGEKNALAFVSAACGLPFRKVRPKWLRSRKGMILELDGYCDQVGLAIEYQRRPWHSPARRAGQSESRPRLGPGGRR